MGQFHRGPLFCLLWSELVPRPASVQHAPRTGGHLRALLSMIPAATREMTLLPWRPRKRARRVCPSRGILVTYGRSHGSMIGESSSLRSVGVAADVGSGTHPRRSVQVVIVAVMIQHGVIAILWCRGIKSPPICRLMRYGPCLDSRRQRGRVGLRAVGVAAILDKIIFLSFQLGKLPPHRERTMHPERDISPDRHHAPAHGAHCQSEVQLTPFPLQPCVQVTNVPPSACRARSIDRRDPQSALTRDGKAVLMVSPRLDRPSLRNWGHARQTLNSDGQESR